MPSSRGLSGEVEVDLGRYEIRRFGRRIKIEKKPMELLILLLEKREQLVSREEIIQKLWRSDPFIDTEKNLNNIVRKLRTALSDDADKPRFLETVVGKGYRFVGPVKVIAPKFASAPETQRAELNGRNGRTHLGERTSVAVLPLSLLGKSVDDQGLCLGFADALVARLGNLPDVGVLPTAAVLNLPTDAGARESASKLGVRFVVHGAMRMLKGQWRLSLEMLDTYLQRPCFTRECDFDVSSLPEIENDIAKRIAAALNRQLGPLNDEQRPRYSRDPLAYAEFMRGYRITASRDSAMMDQANQYLNNAVARDPGFALAHATLSFACATRHFEYDPASSWLEKAEFHCQRALEIDPKLAEAHVARAFLLWGPSKNFQHLEAIAALKRGIALQKNLPHAYNRLGTILAHVGLLDHAHEMFERGRPFQPKKAVNPSVVQVYIWTGQYDLARERTAAWRLESPGNKYAIHFSLFSALMTGDWKEADRRIAEALELVPNEPLIISMHALLHALVGEEDKAIECANRACAIPKSFGHAHHSYYQLACTFAVLGRRETAFQWLERSVSTGFACWPFFLKDPCLENLRSMAEFELLINTLQAKYPDHLGLL